MVLQNEENFTNSSDYKVYCIPDAPKFMPKRKIKNNLKQIVNFRKTDQNRFKISGTSLIHNPQQ